MHLRTWLVVYAKNFRTLRVAVLFPSGDSPRADCCGAARRWVSRSWLILIGFLYLTKKSYVKIIYIRNFPYVVWKIRKFRFFYIINMTSRKEYPMYQPIDQEKTGKKLKIMLEAAGYDVKYIQKYLHLSCPQSIYRWHKGKVLPSVENMAALSRLLQIHMEDLLVFQGESFLSSLIPTMRDPQLKRVLTYVEWLQKIA